MNGILEGMRVVEGSAYVAAPLGGMTLAQLGADVIRFDPIGGGLDRTRWPVNEEGTSLFWAGLNKGKRSIQVDLRSERGREVLTELITAPGPDSGIVLTNFPVRGWLDYERLAERRPDLIMVSIVGNHDGSSGPGDRLSAVTRVRTSSMAIPYERRDNEDLTRSYRMWPRYPAKWPSITSTIRPRFTSTISGTRCRLVMMWLMSVWSM